MDPLTFGRAIDLIREGKPVQRKIWKQDGLYLQLVNPPAASGILPFVGLHSPAGVWAWQPGQMDLLAADWEQRLIILKP